MGKYAQIFLSENIDGEMLLTLDEEILEEFGLKKFHRKKLQSSTFDFYKIFHFWGKTILLDKFLKTKTSEGYLNF